MPQLAIILCILASIGLLAVGAAALAGPAHLSQSYGLPVTDERGLGFVRATGARDLALGGILLASALLGDLLQLTIVAGAGLLLSLADFLIVYAGAHGRIHRQHLTHVGAAAGFAVIIAVLLAALRP